MRDIAHSAHDLSNPCLEYFFPKITFITGVQADVSIWRYEVSRDVNKVASKVGHNELSKWPPLIGQ